MSSNPSDGAIDMSGDVSSDEDNDDKEVKWICIIYMNRYLSLYNLLFRMLTTLKYPMKL
jgi:hypothetical protein